MARQIEMPDFGVAEGGTKRYGHFLGLDYSSDETKIDDARSPEMINMIADEGGFPEKRVGWRTVHTFDGCVSGIFPFEGEMKESVRAAEAAGSQTFLVHAGKKLYKVELDEKSAVTDCTALETGFELNEGGRTSAFYMNGKLYLLTGREYLLYDGTAVKRVSDDAYVPTTSYGRAPAGGGKAYEKVNLLSRYRKNNFTADGSAKVYQLDVKELDSDFTPEVEVNGAKVNAFTTDHAKGTITFTSAPAKGSIEGTDNVKVKFAKTTAGSADMINHCTVFATFGIGSDNRVFLSGNDAHPNREWYSGLADPSYFPDLNYVLVGSQDFPIMCYLKANGELLVVKQDNRQEGTIWHHAAELTNNEAAFPIKEGVPGYGACARYAAASLLDDPLYLTPRGVYASTMTIAYNFMQRGLKCRSKRINPRLNKEPNLADAIAASWKGWYVLAIDGHAYVADGNQNKSDDGYEWYYWDNIPAHVLRAHEQALWFGTKDGRLCRFNDDYTDEDGRILMRAYNDDGAAVTAEWRSKLDPMDSEHRLKTMPKRGSGVHVKAYTRSAIDLYIRTEHDHGKFVRRLFADKLDFNDLDFKRFTFSTVDNSMTPFRCKKKAWKAIQIILKSPEVNEGFGIHSLTVRYFFNNYAKR